MDRLKSAVRAVLEAFEPRLLYAATYRADVMVDHEDGTIDVRVDEARIGDLTRVPLWLGLPGVRFRFESPGHVLVSFRRRDPRLPVAHLFNGGSFGRLVLMDGSASLARVGDIALAPFPSGMIFDVQVMTPAGPRQVTGPVTIREPIVGVIAAGSGAVKA